MKTGKGTAARMIAGQVGVKDPLVLNLVAHLADAEIKLSPMKIGGSPQLGPDSFELPGKINGLDFTVVITGPGAVDCYHKIRG